jgi:hypothetical protein
MGAAASRTEAGAMTEQQLEAIRARCEAATPGPWSTRQAENEHVVAVDAVVNGDSRIGCTTARYEFISCHGSEEMPEEGRIVASFNAEFVAHAREDVPALLAYIEELEADLRMHREERVRLRAENLRLSHLAGDKKLVFTMKGER